MSELHSELVVDNRTNFIGAALAGVRVRGGGALDITGVIQDHLTVQDGGFIRLTGVCDGTLDIRAGGVFEMTGVLSSPIPFDIDGIIIVRAGSMLQTKRVTSTGELVEAQSGANINIGDDARRFRIVRGGAQPMLALTAG